ncbi:MAG: leucine-rich repeat domain-containing protein [Lachnospiraceae bacterium]|nr:leucine-rich repeat domain-containing protein [Lachnospiraceae bacterium]
MWAIRAYTDINTNKIELVQVLDEITMQTRLMTGVEISEYCERIKNVTVDKSSNIIMSNMNPNKKIKYYKKYFYGNYKILEYCIITGYNNGLVSFVASNEFKDFVYGNSVTMDALMEILEIDDIDKLKLFNAIVDKIGSKYNIKIFKDNGYIKLPLIYDNNVKNTKDDWNIDVARVETDGLYVTYLEHKVGVHKATIPSGIYHIEEFGGNVNKLVIPNDVQSLGEGCFSELDDLDEIEIGHGIKYIPNELCYDSRIITVKFSGSEIEIGERAFLQSSLRGVIVTNALIIKEEAFAETNINKANLLRAVVIGVKAFAYCKKLQSIKFGNNLEKIQGGAFIGCSKLETVIFPSTLMYIGKKAFYGCPRIKEVIVPKQCVIKEDAFHRNTKITRV